MKQKRLTLDDLRQAELDPQLKFRMKQKGPGKGILTGQDILNIQKFARQNLMLAQQRNKDMTSKVLAERLSAIITSRRPEVRKTILKALGEFVNPKKQPKK